MSTHVKLKHVFIEYLHIEYGSWQDRNSYVFRQDNSPTDTPLPPSDPLLVKTMYRSLLC